MKLTIKILILICSFSLFGCGNNSSRLNSNIDINKNYSIKETQQKSNQSNSNADSSSNDSKKKQNIEKDEQKIYLGCWSGADRFTTIFQFTENTVHTSVNKSQIIKYENISEISTNFEVYLELKEKDKNNYLQKYIQITPFDSGEDEKYEAIHIKDSNSLDELKNGKYEGRIVVYRDDCKNVKSLLKPSK